MQLSTTKDTEDAEKIIGFPSVSSVSSVVESLILHCTVGAAGQAFA